MSEQASSGSNPRHTVRRINTTSMAISIASSIFWAWFITSTLGPVFPTSFHMNLTQYQLYAIGLFSAAGVTSFFSSRSSRIAFGFLDSLKSELIIVLLGSVGNIVTILGIHVFDAIAIVFLGGTLIGAMGACYMLAWGRMYAQEASRSACLALCLGLAVGTILASLISMLQAPISAFVCIFLPEIVMFTLYLIRSMSESSLPNPSAAGSNSNEIPEHSKANDAFGDAEIFVKPRTDSFGTVSADEIFGEGTKRVFGLSISLTATLMFLGVCASYMINVFFIETSDSKIMFPSDALLIFGIVILGMFALISLFIHHGHSILVTATMLGIIGFMLISMSWSMEIELIGRSIIPVGFAGAFIVLWSMLTEFSYSIGNYIVVGLGAGIASIMTGGFIGEIVFFAFSRVIPLSTLMYYSTAVVSVVFVISFSLTFIANSKLWYKVKENAFLFDKIADNAAVNRENGELDLDDALEELASEHGLTKRESQVLQLLLMGRSRSRISQILTLSENTVSTHIRHIYQKFGVHGLQELIDFVFTH